MSRVSINPGKVEWSGENPGIYLKETPDGDFSTLALFFRVVLSPFGRGHAALILGAPDLSAGWPEAPNLLMTDNQSLMKWIIDGWVAKFPAFRNRPGLDGMKWLDIEAVSRQPGNLKSRYSESVRGSGVEAKLLWQDLQEPLPAEISRENSPTGAHEMYSVFLEARSAEVSVNGARLAGQVASRQFCGRTMSTAFLAFSETWVTPLDGVD